MKLRRWVADSWAPVTPNQGCLEQLPGIHISSTSETSWKQHSQEMLLGRKGRQDRTSGRVRKCGDGGAEGSRWGRGVDWPPRLCALSFRVQQWDQLEALGHRGEHRAHGPEPDSRAGG